MSKDTIMICPECNSSLKKAHIKDWFVCDDCKQIYNKEYVRGYWHGCKISNIVKHINPKDAEAWGRIAINILRGAINGRKVGISLDHYFKWNNETIKAIIHKTTKNSKKELY